MYYGHNIELMKGSKAREATVGQRIDSWLAYNGVKQKELAEMADRLGRAHGIIMTQQDLYHYRKETCQPKADKMHVLSIAMHVPKNWLRGYPATKKQKREYNLP